MLLFIIGGRFACLPAKAGAEPAYWQAGLWMKIDQA